MYIHPFNNGIECDTINGLNIKLSVKGCVIHCINIMIKKELSSKLVCYFWGYIAHSIWLHMKQQEASCTARNFCDILFYNVDNMLNIPVPKWYLLCKHFSMFIVQWYLACAKYWQFWFTDATKLPWLTFLIIITLVGNMV